MSLDLDKLKRLAEAATPGPWEESNDFQSESWYISPIEATLPYAPADELDEQEDDAFVKQQTVNALFIVAAREALPALIDDRDALAVRLAEAEGARRWIPTSERLPETLPNRITGYADSDPVVVWVIGGWGWQRASMEVRDGGVVYWRILGLMACYVEADRVTHWLPITAPDAGAGRGGEG